MTGARVRRAAPGERSVLAAIEEAGARAALAHVVPGQPYPTERTAARWREFDGEVRVAELEGRVVGFVAWSGAWLHALYVLPGAAGRGVGGRLLSEARGAGALWVLEENHPARRFYEHRGWAPDGAVQIVFGARELRYRRSRG